MRRQRRETATRSAAAASAASSAFNVDTVGGSRRPAEAAAAYSEKKDLHEVLASQENTPPLPGSSCVCQAAAGDHVVLAVK